MKFFALAIASFLCVQTASASFQFREFNFERIDCVGSNGVTYQIAYSSETDNIQIDTALGSVQKRFYGNFYVSPMKELSIEMGTHKSGYISEYYLYLPLSPIVTGVQPAVGTIFKLNSGFKSAIGPITCKVQYAAE